MRRGLAVAVLALVAGAAWPAVVGAATLDDVAAALRSDPVYVDAAAERALSESEAEEVRDAIRGAGTPVYVAVVPASAVDSAGGDAGELTSQLASVLQRDGTIAVLAGDRLRAGSSELPPGRAGELVAEALEAGGNDTSAVLVEFVELVGDEAASGSSEGAAGGDSGDAGGGNSWLLPALLVGGAGVGGTLLVRSSRRRKADQERAEAADRELLRAELSVLADDVVRLESVVRLHPDAQSDFDAAVNRYRAAQAAIDHADEPIDLVRVRRVVDEARYSMDRARAVIDGREPPLPPDHLQRIGEHGEPAVTVDDDRQPAYVGYPGGYGAGWYGGMGGGGLFSGLLLGSLLAGGFGGWGHGHTTIINEGGGSDAGDWGGGDFGGGDFGGGDFGGGDFGG